MCVPMNFGGKNVKDKKCNGGDQTSQSLGSGGSEEICQLNVCK